MKIKGLAQGYLERADELSKMSSSATDIALVGIGYALLALVDAVEESRENTEKK